MVQHYPIWALELHLGSSKDPDRVKAAHPAQPFDAENLLFPELSKDRFKPSFLKPCDKHRPQGMVRVPHLPVKRSLGSS